MRVLARVLLLTIVGMTALGAPPPPTAAQGPTTTSLMVPLAGDLFVGTETVALSGQLHVLVQFQLVLPPTTPCVEANLATLSGVGPITGRRYTGAGAATFTSPLPPPNTYSFTPTFQLIPNGPPDTPFCCRYRST